MVSSGSGSTRSLTTSPLVIRSPNRSASAKRASTAGAKWDPKTSDVVVPAATRPATSSPATVAAYDVEARRSSSGRAHRSSHSSSGMPRAPITRTWGKWTWVSTRPGSSSPDRRSMTGASGREAATEANGPRSVITPSSETASPRSSS